MLQELPEKDYNIDQSKVNTKHLLKIDRLFYASPMAIFCRVSKCPQNASYIVIDGEVYGRALRTHKDVKPIFVSIGYFVSLDTSCALALKLTDKESHILIPTRLADLEIHIARENERNMIL